MRKVIIIILGYLMLLNLVSFFNCSKNPLESTTSNEILGIENALAKVGSDLDENEADMTRLQRRLNNAINKLTKLLRRIRGVINDETPPAATRYLKSAIDNRNKAMRALNNKQYRLAIKHFKLANRMATGAIKVIKTGKPLPQ